jgi:hypothetical protein
MACDGDGGVIPTRDSTPPRDGPLPPPFDAELGPTVTISPPSGATGVAVTTIIVATFDRPVTGVSSSSFALDLSIGSFVATNFLALDARTYELLPASNLMPATSYSVVMSPGITDLGGNPLQPVSSQFTTGP